MPRLDPLAIFRNLERHGVAYVVIGGIAATLHGSNLRTGDVDICPSRQPQNLERLAGALRQMEARIRAPGAPGGLPFACDGELLARVEMLNLVTAHGDFDLSFQPAGTRGYEELAEGAVVVDLGEVRVPVASLADVIRSKAAAGRPKDLQQLPTLRLLLEERKRRGDE